MADADLTSGIEPAMTPGRTAHSQSEGLVVAKAPDYFEVAVGENTYLCTLRGRLRKLRTQPPSNARRPGLSHPSHGQPDHRTPSSSAAEPEDRPVLVAPGDHVIITVLPTGEGVIEEILPRKTVLSRTRPEVGREQIMLANLDLAVLVFAVREPAPDRWLLDRYLVICEYAGVPVLICFNKVDLGVPEATAEAGRAYSSLGYDILRTSATTGMGLADLRERLGGRLSLLTGPSGVGKSSLINALLPGTGQRTGNLSAATGKGKHTTTGARLFPLPEGGWLADSAGIRELTPWNIPAEALPDCFVELRPHVADCRYEDCAHGEHEDGCALRAALTEGHISPERISSFSRLLAMARETEEPAWARAHR
jgi:ribosome biogenesis GTPase / thiamine phosphate phosphatase